MISPELERVMAKVRALYALANSDNEFESNNAAAKAEALMQQYRLTQADLESESGEEQEVATEDPDAIERGGAIPVWQQRLVAILSDHYSCAHYFQTFYKQHRRLIKVHVVGQPTDITLLKLQYGKIKEEIDRLALLNAKGQGRSFSDGYRKGLVAHIRERFTAMRVEVRAATSSTALVKLDDRAKAAKATMCQLHPDLRSGGSNSSPVDYDGFHAGKSDGRKINFGQDLPATAASHKQLTGRAG